MRKSGLVLFLALMMVFVFASVSLAHPQVKTVDLPIQSLERLDSGIHRAFVNVAEKSEGIAEHNMYYRFQFEKYHGMD